MARITPMRCRPVTYHLIILLLFVAVGVNAQRKSPEELDTKTRLEAEFYFTEGEKFFILEDFSKALVMFKKSAETDPNNATTNSDHGEQQNQTPKFMRDRKREIAHNEEPFAS